MASEAMVVNLEDTRLERRVGSYSVPRQRRGREEITDDNEDEPELDDSSAGGYSNQQEKKRRLTGEQVEYLEKNFEMENRVEPERKQQLAKELGLQPRQVSIWFQNRRARFKIKQLEKDYDSLKADYDHLLADHEFIVKEKERLKNEVALLTSKLLKTREKRSSNANYPPNSPRAPTNAAILNTENAVLCKQKDASSAKGDVLDSESRGGREINHSSTMNSSIFLETEDSKEKISQEEEDQFRLCGGLSFLTQPLPPPSLPLHIMPIYKLSGLEDEGYCNGDDERPHCESGVLHLHAENQQFWPWFCKT